MRGDLHIKYFLDIKYPKNKFKIVIVTTKKENNDKLERRSKLPQIASDIFNNMSVPNLKIKYLGIFPAIAFDKHGKNFINDTKKSEYEILAQLTEFYDNYPTTHEVVSDIAKEINNTEYKSIKIIEYPDNNKVVAEQINFATDVLSKESNDKSTLISIYNV